MGLSANYEADVLVDGAPLSYPVRAAKTIYKGAMTMFVTSGAYTYIAPLSAAAANVKFAGVAYEKADNSAGADAAINCRVHPPGTIVSLAMSAASSAVTGHIGAAAWAKSDDKVRTTSGATSCAYIGRFVQKGDTTGYMYVKTSPVLNATYRTAP
jgi:hypothetical protein